MIEHSITFKESPPASPEPRKRGSLSQLFNNFHLDQTTKRKSRKSKPLPPTPPKEPDLVPPTLTVIKPILPDIQSEIDIKRICISEDFTNQAYSSFLGSSMVVLSGWTKVKESDSQGHKEIYYYHEQHQRKLRGCCTQSTSIIRCCALCNADHWMFQGSEYNPAITVLYAQMDGCIPASVKLTNQKFIVPWRYKNRRSGKVSWKIIHMCGSNIEDAECETIVVNTHRDKKLKKIMETVKEEAVWYQGSALVEYLLKVIRMALGDYGMPRGATSTQADISLYEQMKEQGHNFMMLGSVRIGLCRHKALLFKILCDLVGLECTLVTGYSTGGRHQWNIITLKDPKTQEDVNYIIDPTSPHFTWTKQGSVRMKAYKIVPETSFGHGGITMKLNGIL